MKLFGYALDRPRPERRILVIAVAAVALSFGIRGALIGDAVAWAPGIKPDFDFFLATCAVIALWDYSSRLLWLRVGWSVEAMAHRIRTDILRDLRNVAPQEVIRLGPAAIRFHLLSSLRLVAQGGSLLIAAVANGLGTLASLLALAIVAGDSLILVLPIYAAMLVVVSLSQIEIARSDAEARSRHGAFSGSLLGLIDAIKEIRLNPLKGEQAFERDLVPNARAAERARARAGLLDRSNDLSEALLVLSAAAACIFVLPILFPSDVEAAVRAAIVVALTPFGILRDLTLAARSESTLTALEAFSRELAGCAAAASRPEAAPATFRDLALHDVAFAYSETGEDDPFRIGPVSLEIAAKTITVISGGNGSGKTTLLHLLTGLHRPSEGRLLLNGEPVDMTRYRDMVSVVYSDCHLFDRLYGLGELDPEPVRALLRRLHLAGKTDYRDGRFTNLNLSAGQRKRVALVEVLMHNKPIVVFDEWAAGQDPEFREDFYLNLLPALRDQGRAVIAVSQDERYFPIADTVHRMDYGRIISTVRQPGARPGASTGPGGIGPSRGDPLG